MTELETKLSQILEEKQNKIIPENIKKGIQIFDIEGTYEGDTSSTKIKLFETQEEMQQDPNANEGDLAVVYREEIQNMTSDTQTQFITFPETVVLLSAITESYYCMLRSIDSSSSYFDGNVMLNQNSFRFDGYSNTGMIRIIYTSSDGITYTREEFRGDSGDLSNPIDLGTSIHCEVVEQWNDNFGYFMQVGGNVFEGLFEYSPYTDSDIYLPNYSTLSYSDSIHIEMGDNILSLDRVKSIINALDKKDYITYDVAYDGTYYYVLPFIQSASMTYGYYDITNNKLYFTVLDKATDSSGTEKLAVIYVIDNSFKLSHTINISELNEVIFVFGNTPANYYKVIEMPLKDSTMIFRINNTTDISLYNTAFRYAKGIGSNVTSSQYYAFHDAHPLKYMYKLALTQLNATKDLVYNSIYYGKDGIEEGTLTQNISNSFADINAEVYSKIQQVYNNMEPRVLTDDDKEIDQNIHFIPTKLDGTPLLDTSQVTDMYVMFFKCENLTSIPQLDTSNVTNMNGTFENCTNLKTIANLNTSKVENMNSIFDGCENLISVPQFDTSSVIYMGAMFSRCQSLVEVPQFNTSKVTKMGSMFIGCTNLVTVPQFDMSSIVYSNLFNHDIQNMFSRCPSLSSDSLNNILKSLLTATSYTETKTLAYIGLSEEQATTCTTLSNWSACEAKGWTTGY